MDSSCRMMNAECEGGEPPPPHFCPLSRFVRSRRLSLSWVKIGGENWNLTPCQNHCRTSKWMEMLDVTRTFFHAARFQFSPPLLGPKYLHSGGDLHVPPPLASEWSDQLPPLSRFAPSQLVPLSSLPSQKRAKATEFLGNWFTE